MKKNYQKFLPAYICDIQEIKNLSKVMLMNNFPHHQFILCTGGSGIICSESCIEQKIQCGDIIFINSSILFSLRKEENISVKRIAFNGNFVANYLQYFKFAPTAVIRFADKSALTAFDTAYSCYLKDKNDIQNSINMYDLIGICGENYVSAKKIPAKNDEFVAENGFDYIKQNITYPAIDFSPFLKLYGISEKKLNSIFINYFGKSIDELIYFYRMEFAKHAVFRVGNTHYESYFNQCGFNSPEKFYKEFIKYTGITVEEYFKLVWAR